jgi:hypothetical protein
MSRTLKRSVKLLFVGGPLDGWEQTVAPGEGSVKTRDPTSDGFVTYQLEWLGERPVMRHSGLTTDDMIEQLIRRYPR